MTKVTTVASPITEILNAHPVGAVLLLSRPQLQHIFLVQGSRQEMFPALACPGERHLIHYIHCNERVRKLSRTAEFVILQQQRHPRYQRSRPSQAIAHLKGQLKPSK